MAWQGFWRLPPVVAISNWVRDIVRRIVLSQHPLAPAVERALDQVRRDGLFDLDDAAQRFRNVLQWIQRHRQLLLALIELISIATEEAEAFAEMSGPDKKSYAISLIHAFLDEYGLAPAEGSLAALVTDSVIDWGIDNLVSLFNRRVRSHRHPGAGGPFCGTRFPRGKCWKVS